MPPSARSAAAAEVGLELYASLMTITPPAVRTMSIRSPAEVTPAIPAAACSRGTPTSSAAATAIAAFSAWCSPWSARRTGTVPARVCSSKRGRSSSSSVTSTTRTSAVADRPTVTTRAALRAARVGAAGQSALRMATPSAGSAATAPP